MTNEFVARAEASEAALAASEAEAKAAAVRAAEAEARAEAAEEIRRQLSEEAAEAREMAEITNAVVAEVEKLFQKRKPPSAPIVVFPPKNFPYHDAGARPGDGKSR